jgi:DNA-binding transcriptional regulator YdaS (Cro superfamily)
MIADIVKTIDGSIIGRLSGYPCLDAAKLFGLAEPVIRRVSSDEVFPVVVDFNGEDTEVFADDDFPLGIYHRLISKTYSEPKVNQQYGEQVTQVAAADMVLICWAFRGKVQTNADVLESLIYSSFQKEIKAGMSSFDRRAVFAGEFSGLPFFLPEDVMLFSMKYKFMYPITDRDCMDIPNFCNT